ncbi:MAG: outer membrane beta-barrel protein [Cyclobacteriaceae bacterium]
MQTTNTWYKLHLCRYQVVTLLFVLFANQAISQNYNTDNLTDYDNEWIHYGYHMGIHSTKYRIKYADIYSTAALDSLHSAAPENSPGWRTGFVVNMRLARYLDVRLLPTVSFSDYTMTYRFTDGRILRDTKDLTTVELPILLKYKSARRGNIAMYTVAGINNAIEVAGRGDNFDTQNNLKLKNYNVSLDAGIGFDLYFPLFKFSPEIRYNWGLRNMLPGEKGIYSIPFKDLSFESFAFYITFEGGPSYLKYLRKKNKKKRRDESG